MDDSYRTRDAVNNLGDRLTSLRTWLSQDWRHGVVVALVIVAAIGAGAVAAAAMQRDSSVGASVSATPSPSSTATAEPMPSATPTATAEPTASLEPSAEATSAPSPSPAPVGGDWVPAEIPGMAYVSNIVERNGRLVALGSDDIDDPDHAMAYSDDGTTWTSVDLSELDIGDSRIYGLGAGEAGFVAFGMEFPVGGEAPEDVYLYSADGATWELAVGPEECVSAGGARWIQGRFVSIGATCGGGDGMRPPEPAIVLTSADGRAWESRIAEDIVGGPWETDGERIVMLPDCCGSVANVAISDDGGDTWRLVPDAVPASVTLYGMTWGHDRFVAEASWLIREGDPDHATCVSTNGEEWACEILGPTGVAGPELRAVRAVTATPTGFASFRYSPDDHFAPSGSTMILGTSTDGMSWTFGPSAPMRDAIVTGTLASSYGLFAWGIVIPGNGGSAPLLLVHHAPLP